MPKRFDCEDNPNEFMAMPTWCDCGKWFDLHDGYAAGNKMVCRECKELQDAQPPDDEPEDDEIDEDLYGEGLEEEISDDEDNY